MANTTTMIGFRSATLDASGASQTLALDPDKVYDVRHLGFDNAGANDSNLVKLELSKIGGAAPDAAVANRTADTDQMFLKDGDVYETKRGINAIKYIAFGGAPMLNVVEVSRSFLGN